MEKVVNRLSIRHNARHYLYEHQRVPANKKSLERTRRAEETAKGKLQGFLDSNYKAIRMMRSHAQIRAANLFSDQLEKLEEIIWNEKGVLCIIGDNKGSLDEDIKAVKGVIL